MSDTMETILERSDDLATEYTQRLDLFTNGLVPPFLSNAEYAARCSALMIALNRELARCAAAFGEVHGVSQDDMTGVVISQFRRNYATALDAVQGAGTSVQ